MKLPDTELLAVMKRRLLLKIFQNSEAFASVLLEHIKDMFLQYRQLIVSHGQMTTGVYPFQEGKLPCVFSEV